VPGDNHVSPTRWATVDVMSRTVPAEFDPEVLQDPDYVTSRPLH
jgi:hypothetical protein